MGKLPYIHVSGDFPESYSIMAIISTNPLKAHPMDYTIGKENGTSEALSSHQQSGIKPN
jgi:hypothetical protein